MFEYIDKHRIKFDLIPLVITIICFILLLPKLLEDFNVFVLILLISHVVIAFFFLYRIYKELKQKRIDGVSG